MRIAVIPPALLCVASTMSFAGNWAGDLVDSDCYRGGESNVSKGQSDVSHDRDLVIRECRPRPDKTKRFALVEKLGQTIRFDPAGNAKAADVVQNTDSKTPYVHVEVTGENIRDNRVKVDSISLLR